MDAGEVAQAAIAEAAEAVAEKIDVLLERATDAVLRAPRPGSAQWQRDWEARDTEDGRAALVQRARVKVAIAAMAGVDPTGEIDRVRCAGLLTPPPVETTVVEAPRRSHRPRTKTLGGGRSQTEQLAIW